MLDRTRERDSDSEKGSSKNCCPHTGRQLVVFVYWLMICQLATRITKTPSIQGGVFGSAGT